MTIEAGRILADKYRVDRVIGQGGMGVVVAATHVGLNQQVAIKLLPEALLANQVVVERFVREARASARLRGEHVCRVTDVGTLESGQPYIVMELLAGGDLASMLDVHRTLPIAVAVDYVLQACLGLAEAHGLGIVHRDVKPANLFVTERPDGSSLLKVLDFGIAKAQDDTEFSLTRTSSMLGSPGYMSPEQLRSSRKVDARTDIWSLGVTLFELVTGEPPFTGTSITELTLHIAMDPLPPLRVPAPPGFEQVLARCLAKDADDRFPDVAALAEAIAPFGGPGAAALAEAVARVGGPARRSRPIVHATPPAGVPLAARTTLGAAAAVTSDPVPGTARRWPVIAAVATAVGAAAIVIVTSLGGEPPARAPVAAPVAVDAARPDAAIDAAPDAAPDAILDAAAPDAAPARTAPARPKRRPKRNFEDLRN